MHRARHPWTAWLLLLRNLLPHLVVILGIRGLEAEGIVLGHRLRRAMRALSRRLDNRIVLRFAAPVPEEDEEGDDAQEHAAAYCAADNGANARFA